MKILAAGQSEANRNNLVLCDKRKPVEFIAAYLKFKSIKSHEMHSEVFLFRGRKLKALLSDARRRKTCKQRSLRCNANIY